MTTPVDRNGSLRARSLLMAVRGVYWEEKDWLFKGGMISFHDLLAGGDLRASARELAGDFGKRFALPGVHQLGLVVPDVEEAGRPVVQHLGFLVRDADIWAAVLAQAGYPVWVKGMLSAWPTSTRFAYMDTVRDAGLVIEFISWRLLGLPFRPVPGLYHALGRIQKLTGKRTVYL